MTAVQNRVFFEYSRYLTQQSQDEVFRASISENMLITRKHLVGSHVTVSHQKTPPPTTPATSATPWLRVT